jgi:YVTN family beta-propeller protein
MAGVKKNMTMPLASGLARRMTAVGRWCLLLVAAQGVLLGAAAAAQNDEKRDSDASTRTMKEGLTIDFEVNRLGTNKHRDRVLREGDDVEIGFTIRDAGSSSPAPGLNPAAWLALSRSGPDQPPAQCGDLVRAALGQTLFSRPDVDLNAYQVVALNADATITVIDPLSGFGGTKLVALLALQSPGEDWALTSNQNQLFVSMPGAGRVAAIDTRSWTIASNVDIGASPTRIALQPDEAYAWVAFDHDAKTGKGSGVAVIEVRTLKVVARIATGRGPHQLAFSDDSRVAFVTNGDEGTVSIVDVRTLEKVQDVAVNSKIASIAFSRLAQAAFVTSPEPGIVTGIGMSTYERVAQIKIAPGIGAIEFAPDGRRGFVTNTLANTLTILDTSLNRVVTTAAVEKGPDQIAFSNRFAYVRHRSSEIVAMLPLDELETERKDVPLLDFPGGQRPLGSGSRSSLAPAIVRSAEDNAVLVANPGDRAIYYYQEGMAAPMGQFSNYGREPVAVKIVDRSLRETKPGEYRSTLRLPAAGQYSALLFLDSPRVIHCFELSIDDADGAASRDKTPTTQVESLTQATTIAPGSAIQIQLRLTDGATAKRVPNVADAGVLVIAPGVWQARLPLAHQGDGVYAVTVRVPAAGLYNVFVACPSRQMDYRRVLTFEAIEREQ